MKQVKPIGVPRQKAPGRATRGFCHGGQLYTLYKRFHGHGRPTACGVLLADVSEGRWLGTDMHTPTPVFTNEAP